MSNAVLKKKSYEVNNEAYEPAETEIESHRNPRSNGATVHKLQRLGCRRRARKKLTIKVCSPIQEEIRKTGFSRSCFSIYNVPTAGAPLWTETRNVTVTDGLFSEYLGSQTPINLPFNETILHRHQSRRQCRNDTTPIANQCRLCLPSRFRR